MSNYDGLPDKDKIELAIEFIALGQPMPVPLQEALVKHGMRSRVSEET